ncbi:MAG TPA: hypothetical protein VGV93_04390 [Acidimicrobiales bacterium]|nr:hypothetical protein [Acidimicrobiales bacterium]
MSKSTALVMSLLAAVVLVVGLVVVLIGGEPVPPELAGTRQAEQLLQGSGPPPSLPDDPQDRACTVALMGSGMWSHAGAGNACALGFVVDSPEAVERCLRTTKEWAAEAVDGITPTPAEVASSESYYAEMCFLLYEGSGDLAALDTEPINEGAGCNEPYFEAGYCPTPGEVEAEQMAECLYGPGEPITEARIAECEASVGSS